MLRTEDIVASANVTHAALRDDFGIRRPRLAVAGLNPHAGEGGEMGSEEAEIIAPAVAMLRQQGIDVSGLLAPDTLFSPRASELYHDQALLIPLKTLDFDGGVNVTLGLPFVRTSPDHGAVLDIAGSGRASELGRGHVPRPRHCRKARPSGGMSGEGAQRACAAADSRSDPAIRASRPSAPSASIFCSIST